MGGSTNMTSRPARFDPSDERVVRPGTGVPLYVQLRESLRERIRSGEWGLSDPLPTEQALSEQFELSRSTVRQALVDLVRDGLLVRHPGKGTFPRQPALVLRMQRYLSMRDDLLERGVRPGARVLSAEQVEAGSPLIHPSLAPIDESVIRIYELRLADDRPAVVFEHYFPTDLCGFLLDEPLDDPELSLYDVVARKHGVSYDRAIGELKATVANGEEATLLDVAEGTPLIEVVTKTFSPEGRVVEYSRAVVRTDRYAFMLDSDWHA